MQFLLLTLLVIACSNLRLRAQEDTATHRPRLIGAPPVACVDVGRAHFDSLWVSDSDLVVPGRDEIVTLEVVEPAGTFTVSPSRITGPLANDTVGFRIDANSIPNQFSGQKMWIVVVARDLEGRSDTLRYYISISDPLVASVPLVFRTEDPGEGRSPTQTLIFGIGQIGAVTTGRAPGERGKLDTNVCEYELPPVPPMGIFDARWLMPGGAGILRNITPIILNPGDDGILGEAQFIRIRDSTGRFLPVSIHWTSDDIRKGPTDLIISDPEEKLFRLYMRDGNGAILDSWVHFEKFYSQQQYFYTLTLDRADVNLIHIKRSDEGSDVNRNNASSVAAESALLPPVPNPLADETTLSYYLDRRQRITITIFDERGDAVRHLADDILDAGNHQVIWDACDDAGTECSSGVYTCLLQAGDVRSSRMLVLVR